MRFLSRVFAAVLLASALAPSVAFADTSLVTNIDCAEGYHVSNGTCVQDTLVVSTPAQPQAVTALPGQTIPAVAVTIVDQNGGLTPITAIDVAASGSAGGGAISGFQVNSSATSVIGTGGGPSNGTAKIPVTLSLTSGQSATLLVSLQTPSDLTGYQGQFTTLRITGIETAGAVQGALPIYGSQITLSTGVAKPTCTLTANPSVYGVGQTVDLVWHSANATGGTITGLGTVGPNGLQGILPSGSGTYTGTFTGPGGTGTCVTSVTFNPQTSGGVTAPGTIPAPGTVAPGGGTCNGGVGSCTGGTLTNEPAVPQSGSGVGQVCNGTNCSACNVASLAQRIINMLIGLSIPLAAALFAWAGILYFTSAANPGQIERAHKIFKYVFWGFLLAIGSWLLVQILLRAVLTPTAFQSWNTISCTDVTLRPGTTPNNSFTVSKLLGNLLPGLVSTNATGQSSVFYNGELSTAQQTALTSACDNGNGDQQSCDTVAALNANSQTQLASNCSDGNQSSCDALATLNNDAALTSVNQNFTGGGCGNLTAQAACVAQNESSCNQLIGSTIDIGADGNSVSYGCFQINLSANQVNGLNCPSAFGGGVYTASNHNTYVINQSLYNQCINAAQNSCTQSVFDQYSRGGVSLQAWGTAARNNCANL